MFKFTKHCLKRMKSRNIKLNEIGQAIRYGITKSIIADECLQCDYNDLRLIISPDNVLITVFRFNDKELFPRIDCKNTRKLYHRKLALLKKHETLAEIRVA